MLFHGDFYREIKTFLLDINQVRIEKGRGSLKTSTKG